MLTRLGAFWRKRDGNFSTLTAITFPVLLLGAGLTLNTGALFLQKRGQQAITDLAAMTAAANLTKADQASMMTFTDNGITGLTAISAAGQSGSANSPTDTLQVEPGHYVSDASKPLAERFTAGASPTNAVRVTAHKKGDTYFPTPVLSDAVIGTTAIALIAPEASFSIGSRVADVDTATSVLNGVLGGLLGASLKLQASDYRALLAADIDAFAFMDALAGELKLTAGTYQQVLDSSASLGTILTAAAKVPGLATNVKTILTTIKSALPAKPRTLALSKLISLDKAAGTKVGSRPTHTAANLMPKLSLLDLINAAAALSNGSNQIAITTGLNILGLSNVTADIAIGEPPQSSAYLAMGRTGTVVYTAQTRVRLVATVGVLPPIPELPLLPKAEVAVSLLLDVGNARGELTSVSCRNNDASTAAVSIMARPALAQMYLADVNNPAQIKDFTRLPTLNDATLVNVSVLNVISLKVTAGKGSGVSAPITNVSASKLDFDAKAIANRTIKTASVRDYTKTLTAALLGSLALNVQLKPLPAIGFDLGPFISPILSGAVKPLDTLLSTILAALGVQLGSVDVWVNGVSCSQPVLVQ